MKIAFDMDGCLVDWVGPFKNLLESLTGRTAMGVSPEWPTKWDWFKDAGFTPDEVSRAWQFIEENPAWWFLLPPTVDGFRALQDGSVGRLIDEHECYFVTNRRGSAKAPTESWLVEHVGLWGTVIPFEGPKGPLYDVLKIDVAIDDYAPNLLSSNQVPRLILIDAPWNRHEDDPRLERMTLRDFLEETVPVPTNALIYSEE